MRGSRGRSEVALAAGSRAERARFTGSRHKSTTPALSGRAVQSCCAVRCGAVRAVRVWATASSHAGCGNVLGRDAVWAGLADACTIGLGVL